MKKCRNKKVEYQGKTFDSRRECERYIYLNDLQKKGKIHDLVWQKKFELIPAQRDGGVMVERPIYYIADFVYIKDGRLIVEDVKGYRGGCVYQLFVIKRKLMLQRYGIRVREV